MKFFRKALFRTVRKRFAWRPRRLVEVRGKWIATGEAKIPYTPGWAHSYPSAPGIYGASSPGKRTKTLASPRPMGMVTPVMMTPINWFDCWIWLEHYLEVYDNRYDNSVEITAAGRWMHYPMPEQWNLWHEYDA